MKNKRLIIILLVSSMLLLIPIIAMQFSGDVNWDTTDFLVAAVLLFGTGLTAEFILRKVKKAKTRTVLIGVFLVLLLLIWMELAVGLFGTPLSGA